MNCKAVAVYLILLSGGASASIQQVIVPWEGLPPTQWTTSSALGVSLTQGSSFTPTYSTPLYAIEWSTSSEYWVNDGIQFTFGEIEAQAPCDPVPLVSPVPLPEAVWLLGSAITALCMLGRRKPAP